MSRIFQSRAGDQVSSLNGGSTFGAPIKMATSTANWCTTASNIRPNFGDYIGATFGGNRVLATRGDGRNGVPDTFYATGLGARQGKVIESNRTRVTPVAHQILAERAEFCRDSPPHTLVSGMDRHVGPIFHCEHCSWFGPP